jgi:hypothetical protein
LRPLRKNSKERKLELMPAWELPPIFLGSRQWDVDGTRRAQPIFF